MAVMGRSDVGWVVMWFLALRFVISSRRIKLRIQEDVRETALEDTAPAYALPPVWPLVVFDLLAGVYFFISAWAHTFTCMEEQYHDFFWMLEKLGIVVGAPYTSPQSFRRICHQCTANAQHMKRVHLYPLRDN